MKFCQLLLSCTNAEEASKVANTLLAKQLIVCAKQIPVMSNYRWQGKIENAEEILLVMESREDLFEKVEAAVAKFHSYDAFVLEAVPVTQMSKKAKRWAEDELSSGD